MPHGNWRVRRWSFKDAKWIEGGKNNIEEAICEEYMLESKESVIDCNLYISIDCLPMDFCYVKLNYDESVDLTIRETPKSEEPFI